MDVFLRAEQRLDQLQNMRDGWFYGKGKAPSRENIRLCRDILRLAKHIGYESIDFAANEFGAISFLATHPKLTIEVILEPNGSAEYFIEPENGTPDFEDTTDDVISLLRRITPSLCAGSEFSLMPISIQPKDESRVWRSSTAAVKVEYPYWRGDASPARARFVITSGRALTGRFLGIHPSSGNSRRQSFRTIVGSSMTRQMGMSAITTSKD